MLKINKMKMSDSQLQPLCDHVLYENTDSMQPKDGDRDEYGIMQKRRKSSKTPPRRRHKVTVDSLGEHEMVIMEHRVKADEFVISSGDDDNDHHHNGTNVHFRDHGNVGRKVTDGDDGMSELDNIPNDVDNGQKLNRWGTRNGEYDMELEGGGLMKESDDEVIDEDGYVTYNYGLRNDEFVVKSDNDDYPKDRKKITLGSKKDTV